MTSIYFEIDTVDESDHVLRADLWRESANGIGRWEVILDPRGQYWPGNWTVDDVVDIHINGSRMMRGYLDDVKPFRNFRDISGYDVGTARHTGLWKLTGRDYGMDLAQMYFTADTGDYQYTQSGEILRDVIVSLVAAGIPCEITPHVGLVGGFINYDWAPRTYLADGFREIAELDDHDFYVQHNAARTLHYFDIATMGAGAEHTAVDLYEFTGVVPTASRTPILELEMGETLGFKLKNYIEVSAGFLDDHWTEVVDDPAAAPNPSPDWIAGPDSTVTEEYGIFMTPHGKGAIRCTQDAAPAGPMYMRCPIPVGNDPRTGLDLEDESHLRYLVYQENTDDGASGIGDNVSIALVDDRPAVPRIIFYALIAGGIFPQDYKYTGPLPPLDWIEVRAPIGVDTRIGGFFPAWQQWTLNWEGAPYVYPGGAFNWSNVQQIVFTSYQTSPENAFFIIDGLQIPTVEVVSRSSVAADPPGWRMKHFKRTDIYDHFVLDDLATKLRDQYRYPLQTLKVTATGQILSKYAGQSLDVVAPAFGIGGPLITDLERYRIFRLHHSVVKNSADSNIPGYTFLTDYELIKQEADATPQLLNPTRMEFNLTPTEAMLREFRLDQKYLDRGKYRKHL